MKTILSILILLISSYCKSQNLVVGMGAGYNINSNLPNFSFQLGVTFGEKESTAFEEDLKQNRNHIYYCQTVSSKTKIMAVHLGRNIKSFQPYVGYGYHLISSDVKQGKESGFKYDYGITFYPTFIPWLYASVGRSGKINLISIGIYRVK